ncbi:MAG: UvrB/UvrC motif-containing protein [Coraliomargarita sp.]
MTEKLKCSLCNKEATVHLTQIINNKIHKVDLCESCAQQKGVTDPEGFALADLLQTANLEIPLQSSGGDTPACPDCGYDSADFQRTGRLGCASCYSTFREQLGSVLEDMHTGLRHVGKVPAVALHRQSSQTTMRNLQDALARAISEEAYEQAATLRDQIQTLKAKAAEKQEATTVHD